MLLCAKEYSMSIVYANYILSSVFVDDGSGGVRTSTIPFSRITFNAACSAARTTSSL